MRSLLTFIAMAGVVMVVLHSRQAACPAPRVELKYLPRDLATYLREMPAASVVYGAMFGDEDVLRA